MTFFAFLGYQTKKINRQFSASQIIVYVTNGYLLGTEYKVFSHNNGKLSVKTYKLDEYCE